MLQTIDDIYTIRTFLIPGNHPDSGGILPQQGRDGDRGFDCFATAITDGTTDPVHPHRLERLWDFNGVPDRSIADHVEEREIEGVARPVYLLHPDEEIILALGMNFDMGDWSARIVPRSSSAGKCIRAITSFPLPYSAVIPEEYAIGDMYADVPVDRNFTGEPRTVLKNFGKKTFPIYYGRKITQLVFEGPGGAKTPTLQVVGSRADFRVTNRNGESHASSGLGLKTRQLGLLFAVLAER